MKTLFVCIHQHEYTWTTGMHQGISQPCIYASISQHAKSSSFLKWRPPFLSMSGWLNLRTPGKEKWQYRVFCQFITIFWSKRGSNVIRFEFWDHIWNPLIRVHTLTLTHTSYFAILDHTWGWSGGGGCHPQLVCPLRIEIEIRNKDKWKVRDVLNLTISDFITLGHI